MVRPREILVQEGAASGLQKESVKEKDKDLPIILIVEDNDVNMKLIKTILKSKAHQMIEAADGEECLDKARALRPHVVVVDLNMPNKDGLAVRSAAFSPSALPSGFLAGPC